MGSEMCIRDSNYTYELDILKEICQELDRAYYQWNGQKHEAIPDAETWVYLVQYTAGAEGWNCITTDTILFYSLNYSYRIMEQSEGRINRVNTSFENLYYVYLKSPASIDDAIERSIRSKKKFNERNWVESIEEPRTKVIFHTVDDMLGDLVKIHFSGLLHGPIELLNTGDRDYLIHK